MTTRLIPIDAIPSARGLDRQSSAIARCNLLSSWRWLIAIAALAVSLSAASAQVIWIGPASGDWDVDTNWSGGNEPGSGDDVLIDDGDAQDSTVALSTTSTINNLGISAGDELQVVSSAFSLLGASIDNAGLITLSGSSQMNVQNAAAVLSGGGTVRLSDTASLRSLAGGTLTNQDNTIEGWGSFGSNVLNIVNGAGGTVDANVVGQVLTIDPRATLGLTNAGIMQASNGGILSLSGSAGGAFDNTGGTIRALDSSEVRLGASAVIDGGTLATTGTGTITVDSGQVVSLSNLAIDGDVVAENNADIRLLGPIANSGSITLQGVTTTTDLVLLGNVELTGGGKILLTDASNVRINGSGTLTNTDNTIEGEGNIGLNSIGIVNAAGGLIDANVSGAILKLDPSSALGLTNLGSMRASGGGILELTGSGGGVFENDGGTIEATDGSEVQLRLSATIRGGSIGATGSGLVRVIGGQVANWEGLETDGAVSVDNGATLNISGAITNGGIITVAPLASNTQLAITTDTQLDGGGEIVLGGEGLARVGGSGFTLTNIDNRISGAGLIGTNSTGFVNQAGGMIDANVAGAVLEFNPSSALGLTNQGLMQASGGGILLLTGSGGGAFANAGGTIRALGGSELRLTSSASIESGLLSTVDDGLISVVGGQAASLSDLTLAGQLNVENSSTLNVQGTITNNGTITINSTGSFTNLTLVGNTELAGGGRVVLANDSVRTRISGGGFTLTNTDNTIEGQGNIGINSIGVVNADDGLIIANVNGETLTIDPSSAGGVTNQGTLRAADGGTLSLTGSGGGEIDNTGGTIEALDGSVVELLGSITIANGTLNTAGSGVIRVREGQIGNLIDVVNNGNIIAENNADLQIGGGIANSGSITISPGASISEVRLIADAELTGGGEIVLTDAAKARIVGTSTLTNTDNTIRGAGLIGINQSGIINGADGVIQADVAGQELTLDPSSAAGLVNDGTLRASGGGILSLFGSGGGTFTVGANGIVEALGGGMVTQSGGAVVTNSAGGTLTGGQWRAVSGGAGATSIDIGGAGITTNAASVLLSGDGASFAQLATLADNTGSFELRAGQAFDAAGDFTNSGALTLGAGGTLNVGSQFLQTSAGTAAFEIGGVSTASELWGKVVATGTAALDGLIEVAFNVGDTFTAAIGDVWQLIAASDVLGRFKDIAIQSGSTPAGSLLTLEENSAGIRARLVGAAGYIAWAQGFGLDVNGDGHPALDFDKDGNLNLLEYALGLNPLVPDFASVTVGTIDVGGELFQTMTYKRPGGPDTRTDIVYSGIRSSDLIDYSSAQVLEVSVSGVDLATGLESVVLRSTVPYGAPANPSEFLSVSASFIE